MPYVIVVGPTKVYVKNKGVVSEEKNLTEKDTPVKVKLYATELKNSISGLVAWKVWTKHMRTMYLQRNLTSKVQQSWSGPYFKGPRLDLVARCPWPRARRGEWFSFPNGVAARLLKGSKGKA